MTQTFYLIFFIGIVFLLLINIFRTPVLVFLKNESLSGTFFCISLQVFFALVSYTIENIFIVEKKPKTAMMFFISDQLIRSVIIVVTVFMYRTVITVLWSLVCYYFFRSLVLFIYLEINYKINPIKINLRLLKAQLRYVFPMGLSIIVGTIGQHADKLILMLLLTSKDFAIYSVGNFQIPIIVLIYTSIGNVILQKISEYSVRKEIDNTLRLWKKMIVKNIAVTIPIVCFFFVLANPIITFLFTENYAESVKVFRIILPIYFVQMLGYGYILRGYSETKSVFFASLWKMIFSLILGFILIKSFGIIGAAITFTIAFSIEGIYSLIKTRKLLKVKWSQFLPWYDFCIILIISIVSLGLLFIVKIIDMPKIVLILISILIYFSSVYFLLIKCKYFSLPQFVNIKKYLKTSFQ